MLFHLTSLFQRQRSRLFEKASGKTDLPNVMHEPAKMREILLVLRKPIRRGDVARVDGDGCRMSSRIAVAGIEGRDESRRKRQVRALETRVRVRQSACGVLPLLPIEQ